MRGDQRVALDSQSCARLLDRDKDLGGVHQNTSSSPLSPATSVTSVTSAPSVDLLALFPTPSSVTERSGCVTSVTFSPWKSASGTLVTLVTLLSEADAGGCR